MKVSEKKGVLDKKKILGKKKIRKKDKQEKKARRVVGSAYKILIKPIVSEKATVLGVENKYVFQVSKKANKRVISVAIQAVYGIKPKKINIVNLYGKVRKYGRVTGRTSDKKKAIVTLPAGKTIQIYEGV